MSRIQRPLTKVRRRSRLAALALAFLLAVSACAPLHARRGDGTDTVKTIAVATLVILGVGLLYGMVADCERTGGNCRDAQR